MSTKIAFINTTKKQLTFLLFVWAIVQIILYVHNGIVTDLEAKKYINEATFFIKNGHLSTGNFYLYSTEIFLIVASLKLKTGFILVVIIHWIMNLLATYMFFTIAMNFLKKEILAVIVTFLYIINIPYQVYNSFLFTESLFYSLTIIYSGFLLRLTILNLKNIIFIFLFLLLLSITRPTGILFFGATAIYVFFKFLHHWSIVQKMVLLTVSLVLFIVLINSMMQSGGELNLMLPFVKENIICGVNTTINANIQTLQNDTSLYGLLYYITHNPGHFLHLAWLKTISFFAMTRSYYSLPHNILLILFYYPFYLMSILDIRNQFKTGKKKLNYFISIIILYWLTSVFTCDDWHGRFFLTISPFLFLLGMSIFSPQIKKPA
ncbi:MAG: hypothetical protein ABI266_07545 [Ginsengibacter sp.]